jgi:hypothetical protein
MDFFKIEPQSGARIVESTKHGSARAGAEVDG